MAAVAERSFTAQDYAAHGWRLTPDRLAAHVTRNDPVTKGFGGGFQIAGPYRRARHVRYLGRKIAQTIARGNGRLIINQPPQTGKSQLVSRWTPAWAEHVTEGRARILLGSYGADFAASWGKITMDSIVMYGEELMLDLNKSQMARHNWELLSGGGMQTSGVASGMTGKPGDIIIIDDPFKDFKEAHSPKVRQDAWDWFWAVPMTRIQPGTTIILLHTRWHEDDLTGRLLASEHAELWDHVRLPALCDDPDTDPLGRELGESLWPDRFGADHYIDLRDQQGPYRFAGMYQQLPAPLTGDLFKRDLWNLVDVAPADMQLVRRWDLAATKDGGDWTAGVLMGRTQQGQVFILDVAHDRLSSLGVEKLMQQTAELDQERYGKRVQIRIEQEPGSSGKKVAENFVSQVLAGYNVKAEPSTGSKELRAGPLSAQHEAGNVHLVRRQRSDGSYETPTWWAELIEEAAVFPNGAHDDMVDAASHAFADLVALAKRRMTASVASPAKTRVGSRTLPSGPGNPLDRR